MLKYCTANPDKYCAARCVDRVPLNTISTGLIRSHVVPFSSTFFVKGQKYGQIDLLNTNIHKSKGFCFLTLDYHSPCAGQCQINIDEDGYWYVSALLRGSSGHSFDWELCRANCASLSHTSILNYV